MIALEGLSALPRLNLKTAFEFLNAVPNKTQDTRYVVLSVCMCRFAQRECTRARASVGACVCGRLVGRRGVGEEVCRKVHNVRR